MLIPNKYSGYVAGIRLYPGGKGGSSSAPPPDPRLVEGQLKSMGIQDDAIKSIMANAADMAPLQKEQIQFGLDSAKTAYGQAQEDRSWSLGRRGALQGLQDTQIAEAKGFNTQDRANELAAQAGADVNQGFASAREQSGRAMARMGVNPNSGRSEVLNNQQSVAQAAALAGAATGARTGARLEGRALTDRASNSLAGYPAMGMAASGAGAGFGASGISIANTGLAGLNSGAGSAAQVAGQMGANATSMYGAQGNYKLGADRNENDASNAWMGMAGTIAGAGITKFSDRRLKRNLLHLGDDPRGFGWYEFEYVWGGGRHVGVMAQEVESIIPAAVTEIAGFKAINYAML